MGGTKISVGDGIVVAQAKTVGPREAAEELSRQLASLDLAMIIVFVSPFYDPAIFIEELTCRILDTPIFGCTTAGELAPSGWEEDSVVAMGFSAEDFIVAARPFLDLSGFRVDHGRTVCGELHQDFIRRAGERDGGEEAFGLLFIDGMCQREEALMSAIYTSLEDIPVVGGSAGDGLRFDNSWIFYDGQAHSDAAILILIKTRLPFRLFKCDHFEPTSVKMVVTEADIERRIVREINAEPAAIEYSRAVGIGDTKLDALSFAAHPVLVRVGGSYYAVRSSAWIPTAHFDFSVPSTKEWSSPSHRYEIRSMRPTTFSSSWSTIWAASPSSSGSSASCADSPSNNTNCRERCPSCTVATTLSDFRPMASNTGRCTSIKR